MVYCNWSQIWRALTGMELVKLSSQMTEYCKILTTVQLTINIEQNVNTHKQLIKLLICITERRRKLLE